MEKQLSFVLMPSLEEMTFRRIAVALWNDHETLASIAKFEFHPEEWNRKIWYETVEYQVTVSLSKLRLPESLRKQMIPILSAIGWEILNWKMLHETYLSDSNEDFNMYVFPKLCWTPLGTVDNRKTAKGLVHFEVVDIVKRFELACLYCLEDYIPMLWKELPEREKMHFYNEPLEVERPHLKLFLPYVLQRKYMACANLHRNSSDLNFFEYSALYGTKTVTEYFFQKLTKREREASLAQTAEDVIRNRCRRFNGEKHSEVVCYLLFFLTPDEQMQIFKKYPYELLNCFLEWPWQELFLDIADITWPFLSEGKYHLLLWQIKEIMLYSGYCIPNLFQNLFLRSPVGFRKKFIDEECLNGHFFRYFFYIQDIKTIKVIFRSVDVADIKRLVCSKAGLQLIYDHMHRWPLVEFCLREALLSKGEKEALKENFVDLVIENGQIQWAFPRWRRFFEFIDEIDQK